MNLLKRISDFFSGGGRSGSSGRNLPIYVLSRRCNEPLAGQVDLYNELSQDEDESGFFCRKVLHTSGESRCFDQVEINIWFDGRKNLDRYEVIGGRWLTEQEYEQELIRFNTPPEEEDLLPSMASDADTGTDTSTEPAASEPKPNTTSDPTASAADTTTDSATDTAADSDSATTSTKSSPSN